MSKQELGPLQAEWIKRLRSGDFTQGKTCLKVQAEFGCEYCCLGIACEVAIDSGIELDVRQRGEPDGVFYFNGRTASLPNNVKESMRFRGEYGADIQYQNPLSSLNDQGKQFSEIADIVCADPNQYFTEPA